MTSFWSPKFFRFIHASLRCTRFGNMTAFKAFMGSPGTSWQILQTIIVILLQKHSQSFPFPAFLWILLTKFFRPFFCTSIIFPYFFISPSTSPIYEQATNLIFQSPHITLTCWLVSSSQLVKLWPPSALFWTSGEGFVSKTNCLHRPTA